MSLCWLLGHVWVAERRRWLRFRASFTEAFCVCCGRVRRSDWSIG